MANDNLDLEDDPFLEDDLFLEDERALGEEEHPPERRRVLDEGRVLEEELFLENEPLAEDDLFDFEDEFERLREKTARTSVVYDDIYEDDAEQSEGGFFSEITPRQWLLLAFLALLDVVVIAVGVLVVIGIL
ncbi:MAG: hypothetical protein R3272_06615 [Candidatus Promineifilaceae bacterium]|nr:hypothetical protein [Candidatus Promineifilaceae bacterium]